MTDRRTFLKQAGLFAASLPIASSLLPKALAASTPALTGKDKWQQLRQLFPLDPNYAHFANFLVTAHPKPVQDAIDFYRGEIDRNPAHWVDWETQIEWQREGEVRDWAARYLQVKPRQIALTGSTTEGLGMIYGGLKVAPDQEILSTEHEHYSTNKILEFRQQRQGTQVRKLRLFQQPREISTDQVLSTIDKAIKPNTRVLGMTWVHSGSGVKLPVGEIGALVRQHNRERDEDRRILYVIDGVHGFGVENQNFADFNCDYFISGTHKWMFGPRGTGIICAASEKLQHLVPTFATFSEDEDFATIMTPAATTRSSTAGRWARRSSCTCNWARPMSRHASTSSTTTSRPGSASTRQSNWSPRSAVSIRPVSPFSGSRTATPTPSPPTSMRSALSSMPCTAMSVR